MSCNYNKIRTLECSYCHETFNSTVFVEKPRLFTTQRLLANELCGEAVGTLVYICPFCGMTNRIDLKVPIDPTEIILRSLDNA